MRSNNRPQACGPAIAALVLAAASWFAAPALAQAAFNVSLDTDYRHRGISLSSGKPTATLNLSYDHAAGAYAGLSAIAADQRDGGLGLLGHVGYVGYARRVGDHAVLDIGATNSKFSRARTVEYSSFYLGAIERNVAVHIHYSQNYFDLGQDALYTDLNASFSPAPRWRLSGHAGWLSYLDDGPPALDDRSDLRITAARAFRSSELRIGVTTGGPELPGQDQTAFVLGATHFF